MGDVVADLADLGDLSGLESTSCGAPRHLARRSGRLDGSRVQSPLTGVAAGYVLARREQ